MEKLNLTQQEYAFTNQKKCTTTQNKHKKLKPGLVTSYDIQPGNGEDLFLFRCFVSLSLTYLRHLPTYSLVTHIGQSNLKLEALQQCTPRASDVMTSIVMATQRIQLLPLSVYTNSGKSGKESLYPDGDTDRHQNLTICSLAHCQPSLKISCKSVQEFLHKVAKTQTDRQKTTKT